MALAGAALVLQRARAAPLHADHPGAADNGRAARAVAGDARRWQTSGDTDAGGRRKRFHMDVHRPAMAAGDSGYARAAAAACTALHYPGAGQPGDANPAAAHPAAGAAGTSRGRVTDDAAGIVGPGPAVGAGAALAGAPAELGSDGADTSRRSGGLARAHRSRIRPAGRTAGGSGLVHPRPALARAAAHGGDRIRPLERADGIPAARSAGSAGALGLRVARIQRHAIHRRSARLAGDRLVAACPQAGPVRSAARVSGAAVRAARTQRTPARLAGRARHRRGAGSPAVVGTAAAAAAPAQRCRPGLDRADGLAVRAAVRRDAPHGAVRTWAGRRPRVAGASARARHAAGLQVGAAARDVARDSRPRADRGRPAAGALVAAGRGPCCTADTGGDDAVLCASRDDFDTGRAVRAPDPGSEARGHRTAGVADGSSVRVARGQRLAAAACNRGYRPQARLRSHRCTHLAPAGGPGLGGCLCLDAGRAAPQWPRFPAPSASFPAANAEMANPRSATT